MAIPSVCSLTATIRAARSRQVDPAEIGQEWLARVAAVLPGLRRGRGGPPGRRWRALPGPRRDPLGVAERVCDHAGVPMTDAALDAMTRFVIAGAGRRRNATGIGSSRLACARRSWRTASPAT
ncbi:hypothetical protein [Salinispora arenicola]|uniref:hypothetical protein n=1 Tax=Salinispora arenicola TaxID=168697 RepID=UPI003F5CE4F1